MDIGFAWGSEAQRRLELLKSKKASKAAAKPSVSESFAWLYDTGRDAALAAAADNSSPGNTTGLQRDRLQACFNAFPMHAPLAPVTPSQEAALPGLEQAKEVYDPGYLLPLLNHILVTTAAPLRRFVACAALSYAVVATSSAVAATRELAYGVVAQYFEALLGDRDGFREKEQVM